MCQAGIEFLLKISKPNIALSTYNIIYAWDKTGICTHLGVLVLDDTGLLVSLAEDGLTFGCNINFKKPLSLTKRLAVSILLHKGRPDNVNHY